MLKWFLKLFKGADDSMEADGMQSDDVFIVIDKVINSADEKPAITKESLISEGYLFLKVKGGKEIYSKNGRRVSIDRG